MTLLSDTPVILRLTQTSFGPVAIGLPIIIFFILVISGCAPLLAAGIGLVSCIGAHWLVQTGVEVDIKRGVQRTFYSILGNSVGSWKPLPPVIGVTLKYFSAISRNATPSARNSWGIWKDSDKRNEEIIVMLSITGSSTGITLQTFPIDGLSVAVDFAQDLADQLGVPLNTYLSPHIKA
jgi:hypothetical protein